MKLPETKSEFQAWCADMEKRVARLEAKQRVGRCPESFEACQAYFVEISAPALAESFWDHGLNTGWTQGKGANPIRDWKAAARLFKRNDAKWSGNGKMKPSTIEDRSYVEREAERTQALLKELRGK